MTRYLLSAGLLALVGCAAPEPLDHAQPPLIGGSLAEDDDAVVALTRNSGGSFCTGTLVSPSVILTAAHCIDMAGADEIVVFFGNDTNSEGTRIGTRQVERHPEWTGSVNGPGFHYDIGLIQLNFPQDPTLPALINRSGADQHVGDPYRVVGFGIFQREPPIDDGRKRTGTSTIDGTQGDVLTTGDDVVSVCFGDSGGPGFLTVDGEEYVAGVHSYTFGGLDQPDPDDRCVPPNGDTRVDLFADDFMQEWIDDNDPVCGPDGTCGYRGCSDDPDCQPCGADGNCTQDCDLPDVDCPTSGLGDLCQADSQCSEGTCVFWQGDPSTKFCTVECSQGDSCPSGMSCQTIGALGTLCYYDEAPPGVVGSDCSEPVDCGSLLCDQGACVTRCDVTAGLHCPIGFECTSDNDEDYFCRKLEPEDEGGCAVGGGGGAGGALLLLGLALLGLRRRT